jgi:hypothetical protein
MTARKRIKHVAAAVATVLLVPGGTPAALADTDAGGPEKVAVRADRTAAERQRRVESAYIVEQHRAAVRATRRTPGAR